MYLEVMLTQLNTNTNSGTFEEQEQKILENFFIKVLVSYTPTPPKFIVM